MASSAFALANTAAKITTIGQLRAAMGAVTLTLSQGYARLADISGIAGEQKAARDLLDTVNRSANLLYAKYTDDPDLQDQEISTWNASLAGQVISQANDALKAVEDAANEKLWDISSIINDALERVGTTLGKTVGTPVGAVANGVIAAVSAFVHSARTAIILVGVVGGVYLFRAQIFGALKKVSG